MLWKKEQQTKRILSQIGEQIKLARLRRDLSMDIVAERTAISRATLTKIEKGDPSVASAFEFSKEIINN